MNAGTKRRNASTDRDSGHTRKARKLSPDDRFPPTPPCLGESAEDVVAAPPLYRTPATKRMASHSSLIESERIVYATDMETQIAAEARGVTRKDIPWDTFRSIYLSEHML